MTSLPNKRSILSPSLFPLFPLLLLLLAACTTKSTNAQSTSCNKYGGSKMTFEGTCSSRNYTWTSQCKVEEVNDECVTSANSCGCQVTDQYGGRSAVGSGSIKGCDNACVIISSDVPVQEGRSCMASGSGMMWEGSCTSRNYTFTPQCTFEEKVDSTTLETLECILSQSSCGCLYWEEGSQYVNGLEPTKCDACAVHGFPPKPSGAATFGGRFGIWVWIVGGVGWMLI